MPSRRRMPASNQAGLFCRTCGTPLASDDELRQGECDRCFDLFAEPMEPPEMAADLPDDLALEWLEVERAAGPYPEGSCEVSVH